MKRMKLGALAVAAVMAASLAGCGRSAAAEAPYSLPGWALEIATPKTSVAQSASDSDKVDVYYDNTCSMFGYVQDGNMVLMMKALRDVSKMYGNTSEYVLQGASGSELMWSKLDQPLFDFYSKQANYSGFGSGSAENVRGSLKGVGPLKRLYYEGNSMDPAAINVVITDLQEQNTDIADLAANINANILSQEGYSAAVIGMQVLFNGETWVDDAAAVANGSMAPGVAVNGPKPIYIILTGAEASLDEYIRNLEEVLQNTYHMSKGGDNNSSGFDYFVARYHAGNSAAVLAFDQVYTVTNIQEPSEMKSDDWQDPVTVINQNLSLVEHPANQMNRLFVTDGYLNLHAYQYDKDANDRNTKRILLNYFVPIYRTDGLDLSIEPKVYMGTEQTSDSAVKAAYDRKDVVRLNTMLFCDDEEITTGEEFMAAEPSLCDAFVQVDDSGKEPTYAVYGWEDVSDINRDKDVTVRTEWIEQGTPVYDLVMNPEDRDADELYPSKELGFAQEHGLLHIQVEVELKPDYLESPMLLLNVPVYAFAEPVKVVPAWVTAWDSVQCPADADDGASVCYTNGLDKFYRTIFGVNVNGNPELERAEREVKVADVLTAIYDLPF